MTAKPTNSPIVQLSVLLQQFSLTCILVLVFRERSVGMLTLSPMTVAPVCHVGDPLQLTCTVSAEFIRWSILQANERGILVEVATSVQINSRDENQMRTIENLVDSVTFMFVRISAQGDSPLISTASIDSVSIGLNGTVIHCMEVGGSMSSASTTIEVIGNLQYTPTLKISEEHYAADNITITMWWAQQVGVTYTIQVSPLVPILVTESTSGQLIIPYNTEYNFSVEAVGPCRPNTTASIRLRYGKCGHPMWSSTCGDSVPKVLFNNGLPIEGNTIRFSCPPGLELTGPNSSTCTENGEWEPDLSRLMCGATCSYPFSGTNNDSISVIGYMDPATEGTTLIFDCPSEYVLTGSNSSTCMRNGKWEPDPRELKCEGKMGESRSLRIDVPIYLFAVVLSAAAVVLLALYVITFITGYTCGRCRGRKITKGTHNSETERPRQIPLYDDILPSTETHHEQTLKLKGNVAYKSMVTEDK